jgi:amino-acid N-acetyltransferase
MSMSGDNSPSNTPHNTPSHTPIDWFRNTAPYINLHRGATFVISIPGEVHEEGRLSELAQDVALLNSLGVRLVLVLGCRPQIERQLAAAGLDSTYHRGRRITEAGAMPALLEAVGAQRLALEAALSMGLPNSPMQGARLRVGSGNFITARPLGVVDGVDFQLTGEVRRIDAEGVTGLLRQGAVALLPTLGFSPTGEVFNLSRADVAIATCRALEADKLILLQAGEGIEVEGALLRQCVAGEVALDTIADAGQRDLLSTASRACAGGVPRCHIVSYRHRDALLSELFTTDGTGTLVARKPFEQSRRASIDDVGGVIELIAPLEESGVLLRRSRELLEAEIGRFRVLERDGRIIACAALYPFPQQHCAELACIVTHPQYRGDRRAQRLLGELEAEALKQGLGEVFVLTTQTAHWFLEQGFSEAGRETLPQARQALYNLQRNSKVLRKVLEGSA